RPVSLIVALGHCPQHDGPGREVDPQRESLGAEDDGKIAHDKKLFDGLPRRGQQPSVVKTDPTGEATDEPWMQMTDLIGKGLDVPGYNGCILLPQQ
ncbi:MAG: hypothetical protein M1598_04970, partial [Actinobacteria bacterium]|nr:hypothetical protein [Actinomycetota bacterium]